MNLLYIAADRNLDTRSIPIYRTAGQATFPNMYSVGPLTVPAGAAVLITAQIEITNPTNYNVGCGLRLIRSSAQGSVVVLPATMSNITPAEHHMVRTFSVWDEPNVSDPTYIFEGYAAASRSVSGNRLIVEEGYGLMQCAVFAP